MDFIGIIGARKFKDKKSVQELVMSIPENSVIVTGACKGVCTWTIEQATKIGINVLVYKPELKNAQSYYEVVKRYYQRNRELIERCDFVHAFISEENGFKGGTKFEVEYAAKIGKPFKLYSERNTSEIVYQYEIGIHEDYFSSAWMDFFADILVG